MARKHQIPDDLVKEEVLALDIAENCGFHTVKGGGTWKFTETKARNDNKKHKHFRDTLIDFIKENGIRMIVAEDVLMARGRFNATVALAEMRGILKEVCDEMNLPEPEFLKSQNIKKFAGKGNASKEEMIQFCIERYGFTPVDDNRLMQYLFYIYLIENLTYDNMGESDNIQDAEVIESSGLKQPQIKLPRKEQRKLSRVQNKFIEILGSFYEKISTNQLTDEELKNTFTAHNKKWLTICAKNDLAKEAKGMFAMEINATWEKKKARAAEEAVKIQG